MRVLHTADWHLGRTLEGRDRRPEQEQFVNELGELAEREKVDLVLLAGDAFDSSNPPAWAEELFYAGLDRLSANGRRAVVVIAGNHDSPERLRAAGPLAHRQGICLLGLPSEVLEVQAGDRSRVRRTAAGRGWLELELPGGLPRARVVALPYPSEARLAELLSEDIDDPTRAKAYSDRIAGLFHQVAAEFRPDTVNLLTSHLFVRGGEESGSERPIQVGGACAVDAAAFPAATQYVALGHLHRAQNVSARMPARYSGSPIAHSFSEAGQEKSVTLIDLTPGAPAQCHTVPLSSGRPLVRWQALDGVAQVLAWLEEGRDPAAWIDLEIYSNGPLELSQIHEFRRRHSGIVHIRPVYPELQPAMAEETLFDRQELFRRFYHERMGHEPEPELLDLFSELLEPAESSE